jgi:hypothetical protein
LKACWTEQSKLKTEYQEQKTSRGIRSTVKDHEKLLRQYEWNMQDNWETMKRQNLWIMGIEEGEKI